MLCHYKALETTCVRQNIVPVRPIISYINGIIVICGFKPLFCNTIPLRLGRGLPSKLPLVVDPDTDNIFA